MQRPWLNIKFSSELSGRQEIHKSPYLIKGSRAVIQRRQIPGNKFPRDMPKKCMQKV